MHTLQDLHDYYIRTKPSTGKIRSASLLMINLCQAFGVDSAEEITSDQFAHIPANIERFHGKAYHKAIQDKSILAEMIGCYGPQNGWQETLEALLSDPDENLRQFTLRALGYLREVNIQLLIPYIERYLDDDSMVMREVAFHLIVKLLCTDQSAAMKEMVLSWADKNGKPHILDRLLENLKNESELAAPDDAAIHGACKDLIVWVENQMKRQ